MKQTHQVYIILTFGLVMMLAFPHITNKLYNQTTNAYEKSNKNVLAGTIETVNSTSKVADSASNVELAIATPEVKEEPKEEVAPVAPLVVEVKQETTVDNNIETVAAQLNKSLNSTLSGTGDLFAKYSIENGVDPYLATAIALHETGCNWKCSAAVTNHNNVGGMMGKGGLIHFDSLEQGISKFILNLKTNYYDKGLNTPELMNSKYAASTTWAQKVNSYINSIKSK